MTASEHGDQVEPDVTEVTGPGKHQGPVDLAEALDRIETLLRRFVVLPSDHAYMAVSLWVVHSYVATAGESTPRLAIVSAGKRSGKTRLLELLELLVHEPLLAANATPAALFRSIAGGQRTVLIDECDAVFDPRGSRFQDLRGTVNAGHRKGGSVLRVNGDSHVVQEFDVFGPMALAGIRDLPDTIMDRSVVLRLQRKLPSELIESFRRSEVEPGAQQIRAFLQDWAEQEFSALTSARPAIPAGVTDRAADVWEPLLSVAESAGGAWVDSASRAAAWLVQEASESTLSDSEALLYDIRTVVGGWADDFIPTTRLLSELGSCDAAMYPHEVRNAQQLASELREYGLKSDRSRIGPSHRQVRGYRVQDLIAVCERQLGATPKHVTTVTSVTSISTTQAQDAIAIAEMQEQVSIWGSSALPW